MTLRFGLFVIGDEILSGKRSDRHLPNVIELLRTRGLSLSWAQYLPDERALLVEAFSRSFKGSGIPNIMLDLVQIIGKVRCVQLTNAVCPFSNQLQLCFGILAQQFVYPVASIRRTH